ncbi:MAG: LPS-assembly protein LptD, partial [Planktomarina sp.]
MIRTTAAAIAFVLIVLTAPAHAQTVGQTGNALLADSLEIQGRQLIASGNVEIWLGGQQIKAAGLRYDRDTDTLQLDGPIRIQSTDGTTVFASTGELNPALRTAILNDARLVLDNRLQLAAAQIRRPNERYTELFKVAATSCYVCAGQVPIWQIRARRILHDADEKQIYLEQAHFRLFDIPVLYLPYFRLPDPTLARARGFLNPELATNTLLGTGLKTPYFIPWGNDKDVTFTPYLSAKTRTLELRYRQAFSNGFLTLNGATTRDKVIPGELRAYLFASGAFQLPRDYKLNVVAKAVSDTDYLGDYEYSSEDRLHSFVEITRTNERSHADLRLSSYYTLRASEDNATIPTIVFEGNTQRRYFPSAIGGEARYDFSILTSRRYSDSPVDGPDADTEVDGFDVARTSLIGEWDRSWTFNNGMVADIATQASLDAYAINQHAGFGDFVANSAATASVGLEWVLVKRTQNGTHVLTPRIQYQIADGTNNAVPNQDSTRVEFDEGNLFDFDRSPGFDLDETGNRLTLGVDWDYATSNGANYGLSVGRIWRDEPQAGFSNVSGLAGKTSDWMIGASWSSGTGLDLISRAIVQDSGKINKVEAHFDIARDQ